MKQLLLAAHVSHETVAASSTQCLMKQLLLAAHVSHETVADSSTRIS